MKILMHLNSVQQSTSYLYSIKLCSSKPFKTGLNVIRLVVSLKISNHILTSINLTTIIKYRDK